MVRVILFGEIPPRVHKPLMHATALAASRSSGLATVHLLCQHRLWLAGRIISQQDKEVSTVGRLVQLASELLKTSLPPHFQVTVEESSL